MKIEASDETISVRGWGKTLFQAKAAQIREIKVIADQAVARNIWARLTKSLMRGKREIALRAVIIRTGDSAVTLDAYHDEHFDLAVSWLKNCGWQIDAALAIAITTPYVRISVSRA